MLLGLDFPPIRHLIGLDGLRLRRQPFAFNKATLIYIVAVGADRSGSSSAAARQGCSSSRTAFQNMAETSVEFVERQVIMQTIGTDGMRFLRRSSTSLFFFIFFINIFEVIPFIQFPANARFAMPLMLALMVWVLYIVLGLQAPGPFELPQELAVPAGRADGAPASS